MSELNIKRLDYAQLRKSLPLAHQEYSDYIASELEGTDIRSLDSALAVLSVLECLIPPIQHFLQHNPHFLTLFEKEWGSCKSLSDHDQLYEICFVEKFLFPETQSCPIEGDQNSLDSCPDIFDQWMKNTEGKHAETQKKIQENFSEDLSPKNLSCPCTQCTADFRALLRESIYKGAKEEILRAVEQLNDLTRESERGEFIAIFQHVSKSIDRKLNRAKFKLRRGTLNKLKDQIDSLLQNNFQYESISLGLYREKLDDLITQKLQAKGLRRDLVEESQKARFFEQRGRGIWKEDRAFEQEINRLIQSVLALKRKDISAKILQDYLGQFWLHTEARKIKRKVIYHVGPTNSGKTYHAIQKLAQAKKGCYLAPLRLLATELYDTLNDMGVKTTLLTGEEVIETAGATHYSSTIEMIRLAESFDMCVIDEIQMINDPQRGWAWTRALVGALTPEIHLCGDPSVLELVRQICDLCGDELEIKEYQRMTDLKILPHKIKSDDLRKYDALIVFSRRNALRYKMDLEQLGYKVSIVYGRLSPEVRREQARKFDQGETDIIVSTDAISMGMNLPIKRVIFTTLSKFIDSKEIPISNSEIKQISGRAGRYKRFPTGLISTLERVEDGLERIQEAMDEETPQKDFAMVGPDLDIFAKVNAALETSSLPELGLSEFLRLFNTMQFKSPFYCVDLKEMVEIAEMVEQSNSKSDTLLDSEIFGFSCAPVNLGLPGHVQFFLTIVNHYTNTRPIAYTKIDHNSEDIDYLETSIKCLELYQWLARHFNNKNFDYDELELLHNKGLAIEKLNSLLSEKITLACVVCGCKLPSNHEHSICDSCFRKRRFSRRPRKFDKKAGERNRSSRGNDKRKKQSTSSQPRRRKNFPKG